MIQTPSRTQPKRTTTPRVHRTITLPIEVSDALVEIGDAHGVGFPDLVRAAFWEYLQTAEITRGFEEEAQQIINWAERLLEKTPEQSALRQLKKSGAVKQVERK